MQLYNGRYGHGSCYTSHEESLDGVGFVGAGIDFCSSDGQFGPLIDVVGVVVVVAVVVLIIIVGNHIISWWRLLRKLLIHTHLLLLLLLLLLWFRLGINDSPSTTFPFTNDHFKAGSIHADGIISFASGDFAQLFDGHLTRIEVEVTDYAIVGTALVVVDVNVDVAVTVASVRIHIALDAVHTDHTTIITTIHTTTIDILFFHHFQLKFGRLDFGW